MVSDAIRNSSDVSKALQAHEGIKSLMATNRLHPGRKLIYRELDMSKTPFINGLMILEQEGLVLSEKNRGYFIRPVNASPGNRFFSSGFRYTPVRIAPDSGWTSCLSHELVEPMG